MAKYKCLPNYELTRNGVTFAFDLDGNYETNVDAHIKVLDECAPFIERIDKPAPKKTVTTTRKTTSTVKK